MSIAASFAGNVGQDPELRFTASGTAILSFSVATRSWDKKDGEKTTWVKCSLFGKRGESVGAHLKRGSTVFVRGALQLREWANKDGEVKTSLECNVDDVEYVGGKGEGGERRTQERPAGGQRQAPRTQGGRPQGGYADDHVMPDATGSYGGDDRDIPF